MNSIAAIITTVTASPILSFSHKGMWNIYIVAEMTEATQTELKAALQASDKVLSFNVTSTKISALPNY